MEQGFKIKYKITPNSPECVPPLEFNGIANKPTVIYEGSTAYVVRTTEDGSVIKSYSVYFFTNRKYWKYINECTVKTFEDVIRPRIEGTEPFYKRVLRHVKNFNK
jgi:hypothetical protein